MNKLLLLLCIASAFNVPATAQEVTIKPGLKIGINHPFYSNQPDFDQDEGITYKPGLTVGFQSEFRFTPLSGIGLELAYSYTMMEYSSLELSNTTSYLDIPFFYKHYVYDGLSLHIGVKNSIFLRSKTTDDENDRDYKVRGFKKQMIAGILGAGYVAPNGVTFDARYNPGITDIGEARNVRLSTLNVTVGYLF